MVMMHYLTANATETTAYRQSDGSYKLYGYKWFTSATDADMTLTLARIAAEYVDCNLNKFSSFNFESG